LAPAILPELILPLHSPKALDASSSETLFRRLLENLRQFYLLLVLIVADLTLLFIEHPFHTVYFFAKDSTRDIMYAIFYVCTTFWNRESCTFSACLSWLTRLARSVLEVVQWWYSAWRWRMESEGAYHIYCIWASLTAWIGKGSGNLTFQSKGSSYWPFNSEEEAFSFLDVEFSTSHGTTISSADADYPDVLKSLAHRLPDNLLNQYIEHKRKTYEIIKSKQHPFLPSGDILRNLLRCYNTYNAGPDLVNFATEYYGANLQFGYVKVGKKVHWLNLVVGSGYLGTTSWKRVQWKEITLVGVVIGILENSAHYVLVEPGQRVFLVVDVDGHTDEHPLVPYTIVPVFQKIDNVGTALDMKDGTDDYNFSIEDIEEEELPIGPYPHRRQIRIPANRTASEF
jgi:hypothetical protein